MRELNNKIRNNIANAYYLRSLAKDDKVNAEKRDEIYNCVSELDKKIQFYKRLSVVLKEIENDKRINKSNSRQR